MLWAARCQLLRIVSTALLRAQRLATEERELNERIAEVDTRIVTKRREIGIANNPAIKVSLRVHMRSLRRLGH